MSATTSISDYELNRATTPPAATLPAPEEEVVVVEEGPPGEDPAEVARHAADLIQAKVVTGPAQARPEPSGVQVVTDAGQQ